MTGYKITIEAITDKSEKEIEAAIMQLSLGEEVIAGYHIEKV